MSASQRWLLALLFKATVEQHLSDNSQQGEGGIDLIDHTSLEDATAALRLVKSKLTPFFII